MEPTTTAGTHDSAAKLTELEGCRAARAREEALLRDLREKRPELLKAYAADMQSASKRGELAALDDSIRHHEVELEALHIREAEAEAAHVAAVRAEMREKLDEILRRCDADVLEKALRETYVDAIVQKEREICELVGKMRAVCAGQNLYAAEAEKLAHELGEPLRVHRLRPDAIRVAGSYAIALWRGIEKRDDDESSRLAIWPASEPHVWVDGRKQASGIGTAEDFEFARAFLSRTN
jgi:hypothetical protein